MKIAVSSMGNDLESPFSPVFGRCPVYVLVNTDNMIFEAFSNHAASVSGGAGIQAAQDVAGLGVQGVVTGNIGPNAYQVLASAGVPVHVFAGGTVRQAVEAYMRGQLTSISAATGPAHGGVGMMRGMGRGMRGRGTGGQGGYGSPRTSPGFRSQPFEPAAGPPLQEAEMASLRAEVEEIRDRLVKLSARIEGGFGG